MPGHGVALFADDADNVLLTRLPAPRRQPEIGADIARAPEPPRVLDGGGEGQRGDRADARHRCQIPARLRGLHHCEHPLVQRRDLRLYGAERLQKRVHASIKQIVVPAGRPCRFVELARALARRQPDPERAQHPADLTEKRPLVAHQLIARRQQRLHPVALLRLDENFRVPARLQHLRQRPRVRPIGLHRSGLECGCRTARIHHDDRQVPRLQRPRQPRARRASLQPDPHDRADPPVQRIQNHLGMRVRRSLPDDILIAIHHANRRRLEAHIQSNIVCHRCSPSWLTTRELPSSQGEQQPQRDVWDVSDIGVTYGPALALST